MPASILKFTKSIELPLARETLLAAAIVVPVAAEVKKVCSELWAVVASVKLSCCRTRRIPTLAKSSTCWETVKLALVVVAGWAVAVVAVDITAGVVVATVDVVEGTQSLVIVLVMVTVVVGRTEDTPIVNVVVVDWPAMIVRVAIPTFSTAAASTTLFDKEPANTAFETVLLLASSPFKVTRAFWEVQLRFPALSLPRIAVSDRVMVKLVEASVSRRGMASPKVTLLILVAPDTVVVVQPAESEVEQSKPVKPLLQMQEQMPLVTTLVPPFWQVS